MAFDLQKLTPNHMLHAGRYSALGHGRRRQRRADPVCCRNRWCAAGCGATWLPDIYLNPHGYPSHEWVEQFSGYVPPQFRDLLVVAGWYTNHRRRSRSAPSGAWRRPPTRCATPSSREINSTRDVHNMRRGVAGAAIGGGRYGFATVRLRTGDLQGHRDLLQRFGDRRAARIARAWRRRGAGQPTRAARR